LDLVNYLKHLGERFTGRTKMIVNVERRHSLPTGGLSSLFTREERGMTMLWWSGDIRNAH
jgi:hypothetical protein